MVEAPVLEPIDPGSILAEEFLEGHDFKTRHGTFGGRPP
jgi:plasmid maintenance system antidote protein VapI